jgi:hypothetical protein
VWRRRQRWRDGVLAGDWLTNLAIDLNQCSHAALDAAATELAAQPITRPTRGTEPPS